MPNPIKYSTGSESDALKKGNLFIGTGAVGKGPSDTTGYYQGPSVPTNGYVIYMNKVGAPGGLSYHSAANDSELISFTNSLAGQSFTGVNQCFDYYYGQTDKVLVNQDYPADYPYIVMDGLVLNLDAGITQSYSGSGTTWSDINGLGPKNNGTLTNGPTFNSVDGGSIVFDGVDDYVNSNFPVSNNSNFSVCIWVYLNSGVTTRRGILSTWDTSWQGFGIGYGISNPDWTIRSWVNNGAGGGMNWDLVSNYEDGFHYMVLTYDYTTGTQKGYIDANYKIQEVRLATVTHSTFQIARGGQSESIQLSIYSNMSGEISNIQVYNKELSQTEITQNFNATKERFGL